MLHYRAEYGPFEDDGFDEFAALDTSDPEEVPVAKDTRLCGYPFYGS